MPGCLNSKSIVTRKLEGVNHFHYYLCRRLSGGMEIYMNRIVVKCDKCGEIGLCNDTDSLIDKINNCNGNLIRVNITEDEFDTLCDISEDNDFLQAMIDLKQKDIIEYNLKMSQFKAQLQQQTSSASQTGSMVRCPRCGSPNITAGQRGYSLLTGFVGSGSTVNRCANCGHKWKP